MVEYKLSALSAEKKEVVLEDRDYMIYEMLTKLNDVLTKLLRKFN